MAVPPAPQPPIGSGKSLAAVAAGALSTLILGIINHYAPTLLTPAMNGAIQTLVTVAAVYWTPHNIVGGR